MCYSNRPLCTCERTNPVVSAHGVEAVGAADEHQVVVSGNQHFDEVVALLLKADTRRVKRRPAPSLTQTSAGGLLYLLCVFP